MTEPRETLSRVFVFRKTKNKKQKTKNKKQKTKNKKQKTLRALSRILLVTRKGRGINEM
jgi:hypothetical protein